MFYCGKKFKMIKLIDYIFYRIASVFNQISSVGIINSISIISIVYTWNLVVITKLFMRIINKKFDDSLILLFIVFFVLVSFNCIRYFKFTSFKELHLLWKDEDGGGKKKKGLLIIIYISFSLFLYVEI